jgi:hypothetical protein
MARFVIGGSWAEYTRHPAIMGDLLNDGDLAITRLRRIIQARSRGVYADSREHRASCSSPRGALTGRCQEICTEPGLRPVSVP